MKAMFKNECALYLRLSRKLKSSTMYAINIGSKFTFWVIE